MLAFCFCLVSVLRCEIRGVSQCELAVDTGGGGKQPGSLTWRASWSQLGHEGSAGKALPESRGFPVPSRVTVRFLFFLLMWADEFENLPGSFMNTLIHYSFEGFCTEQATPSTWLIVVGQKGGFSPVFQKAVHKIEHCLYTDLPFSLYNRGVTKLVISSSLGKKSVSTAKNCNCRWFY